MGLHADYAKERLGWETIEITDGFVQYSLGDSSVFVRELYVAPEHRGKRFASDLLNLVAEKAIEADKKTMLATICPYAAGNSEALARALKYGFRLVDIDMSQRLVVLAKDLSHG